MSWVSKAGAAFYRSNKLWKDQHLAQSVKLSVYQTVVQATLLYECEAWAASQVHLSTLETFHMSCLRKTCRINKWQRRTNQDILFQCRTETVLVLVRYCRLRWLGHVARMSDDRIPKRLLFGNIDMLSESGPGRPKKSWQNYVREDLASLNMSYDWHRLAPDRITWRSRIQKLLTHD